MRAVVSSSVVLGLLGLAFAVESTRVWVFALIPTIGLLAAAVRQALRRALHRRRAHGECVRRVLAVGGCRPVADLIIRTRRELHHGWSVGGVCVPAGVLVDGTDRIQRVPVVGDLDSVPVVIATGDYQVVAVAPADGWSPKRLHQLSWDLEGRGIELVVHPGLLEVAGPRLHVTPVDGLPLLRLTEPTFSGVAGLVKAAIDRVAAALLLLVFAPLLLVIFVAVRMDGGPALIRRVRIGRNGRDFCMFEFRVMVEDAEQLRRIVKQVRHDHSSTLLGTRDPLVTPLGVLLRRYSLDGLPQLANVALGTMSLVGPRPQLPAEVKMFTHNVHRKLLVRPGMTGPWRVNGRGGLSGEEAARLDLRYVENWSPALDLLILGQTVRAMWSGDGGVVG
jgi:lipopolysaccharide/colanic/teichoic acid biosynthesis glycosyltransferase